MTRIVLGSRVFKTKRELLEKLRLLKNKIQKTGEEIRPDSVWFEVLYDIFTYHPRCEELISHITHFKIGENLVQKYPSRCWYACNSETGERQDFSIKRLVSSIGREKPVEYWFNEKNRSVMRLAIEPQMNEWAEKNGGKRDGKLWHRDHIHAFCKIANEWIEETGYDRTNGNLTQKQLGEWKEYHKKKASYQWLPSFDNMSKGKK